MENKRVLLAEDDKNLGTILQAYLVAKGYETDLCVNGEEAFKKYQEATYDMCILDVMMPIKDGFTLAQEIRNQDKEIPILFLTAKSLQEDKLKGFEIGADDYISKPFSMEELLVRMKAIWRRVDSDTKSPSKTNIYTLGQYTFSYGAENFEDKSKMVWEEFEKDLIKLNNYLKSKELKFAIIISPISLQIPYHEEINHRGLNFSCSTIDAQNKIKEILVRNSIDIIDPTNDFIKYAEVTKQNDNFN